MNGEKEKRKVDEEIQKKEEEQKETLVEKVVDVNRVSTVVKGGRRFSFTSLVVVGDEINKVGYGYGKANEVSGAIKKALIRARRNMFTISISKNTIPHEVVGKFGSARVLLRPASEGTGVVAGGPVRAVCESVGIKDILTKSFGSSNSLNILKAAVEGLKSLKSPEVVQIRKKGKDYADKKRIEKEPESK